MEKFNTLEDYAKHLEESKIGCFTCKYMGSVTGSCHKKCNHPSIEPIKPIMLLQMAQGVGSINPTRLTVNGIPMQKWNKHGIEKGWVIFPMNFDPVWLQYCLMYDKKD